MTKTIALSLESEERQERNNTVLRQCTLPKSLSVFQKVDITAHTEDPAWPSHQNTCTSAYLAGYP